MGEIVPAVASQEEIPHTSPSERETFAAYIQITGPVFYNKALSDKAKLLYGLLSAMTQAPRYYAWARNRTMMKFLDCSERTLQRCMAELEKAGELIIEDGGGGRSLRKIRVTRLQPVYPDKNDGDPPDKSGGGNKNNRNKNKCRGEAPAATQEDIIQWFNVWVAKQELSMEDSTALCTDLRDFAENRAASGKPFKTIKAASRMAGRLLSLSEGATHRVGMMRYLINHSVLNNWADVFPLKERDTEDFNRFLASEYGIGPAVDNPEYF